MPAVMPLKEWALAPEVKARRTQQFRNRSDGLRCFAPLNRAIHRVFSCIIRASDSQTCLTVVVYRAAALACRQGQRQIVDGASFRRGLRSVAAGGLSENRFPDSLI